MKKLFNLFYTNLFLGNRLFAGLALCVVLYVFRFLFSWLGSIPDLVFCLLMFLLLADLVMLYGKSKAIFARRHAPERLSNSDENELGIYIESFYAFKVEVGIIDEIPHQFQRRDVWFKTILLPRQQKTINYSLRPTKRGEYEFGQVRVFVKTPLALVSRRFNFEQQQQLAVYPSFLQMQQYEMMAISKRLSDAGIKRMRRLGHSMEFEQIRNYVMGDDYRTLNWKATARHGNFMVNTYTEEKSQHLYCVIDKSRAMKMPFNGLSLLDYAINASLALANVAIKKEDKAGLITIAEKVNTIIPADRKAVQVNRIMEALYKEKTRYLETNMEALYASVRGVVKQRSLLVFFTNYESLNGMRRQLPFLKRIAKFHMLLVVFFDNTELSEAAKAPAADVAEIYIKTVAGKFVNDKKQIVKELASHGIQSILTAPENLTVNAINRYLEIKARQLL